MQPEWTKSSWKEIAAYLGKGVRTVVRWEKSEGLPVHRHLHDRRSSVFAYKSEIDAWWQTRRAALDPELPATGPTTPAVRRVPWVILTAIISLAGLAVWFLHPPSPSPLELPLKVEPLTSYPGAQIGLSFSPDGSHFAFAWNGGKENPTDIYVQAVGSAEAKRLTAHEWMDFSPVWSPDGKEIAFLRRSPQRQIEVWSIPSLGGIERKLADLKEQHYLDAPQLSWSPDGKWLAFADGGADGYGIFLLAPETGERRRLTKAAGPRSDLDPSFSPDGRSMAFRRGANQSQSEIYIQSLTKDARPIGSPRQLTYRAVRSTSPVWSGDGRYVFFSSGVFNHWGAVIYRVQAKGPSSQAPEQLTASSGDDHFNLATCWRGGLLAYTRVQRDLNIWSIQRTGNGWLEPERISLLASTRSDHDASFSPDGRQLAFVSDRSGHLELWIAQADGTQLRKLTSFEGSYIAAPRWSPDGKLITFSALHENVYAIWTIDAVGGAPRKIAEPAWSSSWSHDGKWIYYSPPVPHAMEVFKVSASGGSSVRVVNLVDFGADPSSRGRIGEVGWEIGNMPADSSDGRLLFLKTLDGIWKFPLSGGKPELAVRIPWYTPYAVSRSGLFFHGEAAPGTNNRALLHYSFADGVIREVVKTGPRPAMALAVSSHDRTVLVSQIDNEITSLLFARGLW